MVAFPIFHERRKCIFKINFSVTPIIINLYYIRNDKNFKNLFLKFMRLEIKSTKQVFRSNSSI